MVIVFDSPVTSISYRNWMSLEICEDPVLLVNVAINLLCLYRSVWIFFLFEHVFFFAPRSREARQGGLHQYEFHSLERLFISVLD